LSMQVLYAFTQLFKEKSHLFLWQNPFLAFGFDILVQANSIYVFLDQVDLL
jgi:hypothetical protein